MSIETQIGDLNAHFFFKEFTYSSSTFSPAYVSEVELADNLLWLDREMIIYQLKEREPSAGADASDEETWFQKKVLGKATKQVRDTLQYLDENPSIDVTNHRGHKLPIQREEIDSIHKVVCYLGANELPDSCRMRKFHRSKTAGVIHLFPANDYLGVVQTLLTPPELIDYLAFREELIDKWGDKVDAVPEPALVGQYLIGDIESEPSESFLEAIASLEHRSDEWDMSGVIGSFPDRVTTEGAPTDYYPIVTEIAKLKRNELREFKLRFKKAMEACQAEQFVLPYRFASPRTGCGFLFLPLEGDFIGERRQGLVNLTCACKYDLKLGKCIGASFAPEGNGFSSVEWCFTSFPWEENEAAAKMLEENSPFRPVGETEIERYEFGNGRDAP